jgi:hypothetical protein
VVSILDGGRPCEGVQPSSDPYRKKPIRFVGRDVEKGVPLRLLSFWTDPVWKGLRIVSFVSATVTLVILVAYFSGVSSWRVPLEVAILTNLAVFVALLTRTFIVRARGGRPPTS